MPEQTVFFVEGSCPTLVVDEDAGIRLDCTLEFRASCELTAALEAGGTAMEDVRRSVIAELQVAYIRAYPAGIPVEELAAGHPDSAFSAEIAERLNRKFKVFYGTELASFSVEEHRLEAADRTKLEQLREKQRLTDPGIAAEELRRKLAEQMSAAAPAETPDKWVCECGRDNGSRFCPDCGRPRSYARWRCSCGAVNTGRFCTECGKRLAGVFGEA